MPRIFMSYRRADSSMVSGRLYDRLAQAFGTKNIFMDVDDIPPGQNFLAVILEAVARCDVLLVVIGRQWLDIQDEHGTRRIDNQNDYVRLEIEEGLRRKDCLVIPILVNNAEMPSAQELPASLHELSYLNAVTIHDDPDFHRDVTWLITQVKNDSSTTKKRPKTAWVIGAVVAALIVVIIVVVVLHELGGNKGSGGKVAAGRTKTPDLVETQSPASTHRLTATDPPAPTLIPSLAPTETPTLSASATTESTSRWAPTVTVAVARTPSPIPQLSSANPILVWAEQEGVKLAGETLLSVLSDTEPYGVTQNILLPSGTQVRLLSDSQLPHPVIPTVILRKVKVLSGVNQERLGWIDQAELENTQPITPRATSNYEYSVNIRYGDDLAFGVMGQLHPGEYALILGVSTRNTEWYQVQLPDSTTGWVLSNVVTTIGDVSDLQQVSPPALPVKPTSTPKLVSTPVPTLGPIPAANPTAKPVQEVLPGQVTPSGETPPPIPP